MYAGNSTSDNSTTVPFAVNSWVLFVCFLINDVGVVVTLPSLNSETSQPKSKLTVYVNSSQLAVNVTVPLATAVKFLYLV